MNMDETLKVEREEGKMTGLRKALSLVERVSRTEREKRERIGRSANFSDEDLKIQRAEDKLILTIQGLIEMEMKK